MIRVNQKADAIRWAAYIFGFAFAIFISFFAMDVFTAHNDFLHTVSALFKHLIPTFLIIIILLLSWRREWIGGTAFSILGFLYIIIAWGRFAWGAYAMISGPLFILGFLFFLGWHYRRHQQA